MNIEKIKKLMDMLPEADRMSIISVYKDGWVGTVPKNVQKLLDLYAKLTPEDQKIFDAKCWESEDESEEEMESPEGKEKMPMEPTKMPM